MLRHGMRRLLRRGDVARQQKRGLATDEQMRLLAELHRALPPPRQPPSLPPAGTLRAADASATELRLAPVTSPDEARSLRCCLIGPTNAGKSTLLNALVDRRVSIVSDKIHTTRRNTVGFLTDEQRATQIQFIDAPGSLGPDVPILQRPIWEAVRAVDLALVVVDAADGRSQRQVRSFLGELAAELKQQEAERGWRAQTVLVLNKVDRVKSPARLAEVTTGLLNAAPNNRYSKKRELPRHAFDWPALHVSATKGRGMSMLRNWLLTMSRPGEWKVAADVAHLQPPLEQATEIIRAHIYRYFHEELPYVLGQRNIGWTEQANGSLRIDQEIVLPNKRRSTRTIVERRLPLVGKAARLEIGEALGRPVHLFLHIGQSRGMGDDLGPDAEVVGVL